VFQAQESIYDFRKVDSLAISTPDTFASQDILTQHLTENFDSELMKLRSIYYWIINNIDYDDKLVKISLVFPLTSDTINNVWLSGSELVYLSPIMYEILRFTYDDPSGEDEEKSYFYC
jgi:hypothetical protein